jgi:hypothetical protein
MSKEDNMTHVISHGSARGGMAAMAEALNLWAQCAEGGADSANLPAIDAGAYVRLHTARAGFEAAVEALTKCWDAERTSTFQKKWRDGARETLTKAAGHLLAACKEVERGNRANARYEKSGDEIHFFWEGTKTQGRYYDVQVNFLGDDPEVFINWNTATGVESSYLHLPSMTDEADPSVTSRREGGWTDRGSLD